MKIIDKIEILENGIIQVRTRKIEVLELKNGETREIDHGFNRHILTPGQEDRYQKEYKNPERLNAIKKSVWTDEVIAQYKRSKKK